MANYRYLYFVLCCVPISGLVWLLQGVQDLAPAVGHRGQGTLREGQPGPPADIHVTGKIFYGFLFTDNL